MSARLESMRGNWRRRLTASLLGLISLLAVSSACGQSMPSVAATDRGLFWKVEKDGRTSYLLGHRARMEARVAAA